VPVTTLDPITALIMVDLQTGPAGMPTVHPFDDIVANAAKLADAFRAKDLPVVLVNVAGGAPGRSERGAGNREFPDGNDIFPKLGETSSSNDILPLL
jgi:nicotinamidase-related amidase